MSTLPTALSIACTLIQCPSVTPHEAGALSALQDILGQAGFTTHRLVFSQEGTPDVDNLYARIGSKAPCLVFAGHVDVVPPGDPARWRFDPFSAQVEDGFVWGRGASDMKGGVAASVAAALSYLAQHGQPEGSIAFLITGDEEGPAINGTVKMLEWAKANGEVFDHCILPEPTCPETLGDMMKIGRRGSLSGEIVVEGIQGHVAYPHLADNPIPGLLKVLTALGADPLDQGTQHFDASNLEITSIDVGNGARNVIPASAKALFNIRFNDLWTPASLEQEIRERAAQAGVRNLVTLSFEATNALAFLTQPGSFTTLLSEVIEAETGLRPVLSTTGGTSDARFICQSCPVIEFGPVNKTIHQVDERVAAADIEKLAFIFERVLEAYFSTA